ncbi:MAG: hypothetical protein ACI4A3_03720 [Lachnospiraceae bacterium]
MGNNQNKSSAGSIVGIIVVVFLILVGIGSCSGGSNDKYTCKYCGEGMEAYWSYHDGYVCYSCDKKFFK